MAQKKRPKSIFSNRNIKEFQIQTSSRNKYLVRSKSSLGVLKAFKKGIKNYDNDYKVGQSNPEVFLSEKDSNFAVIKIKRGKKSDRKKAFDNKKKYLNDIYDKIDKADKSKSELQQLRKRLRRFIKQKPKIEVESLRKHVYSIRRK